jgi:hypothetical protein
VQVEQGDLLAAQASYQASLAIRERLARTDPGNASWQRDLLVAFAKLAQLFQDIGDIANALRASRNGLSIVTSLSQNSPQSILWRQEIGWFSDQITRLTKAQSSGQAARRSQANSDQKMKGGTIDEVYKWPRKS